MRCLRRLALVLITLMPALPALAEAEDGAAPPPPHEDPALREAVPEPLHIDREPLPPDANAWPLLVRAVHLYVPPSTIDLDEDALDDWGHPERLVTRQQAAEDDTWRQVLDANADALRILRSALERETAHAPIQQGMSDSGEAPTHHFRHLGGLQLMQARAARLRGDTDAMFDRLAEMQRYGGMLARSGRSLLTFLAGAGVDAMAASYVHTLIHADELDEAGLRRAIALLSDVEPLANAAADAVRAEFWGVFAWELRRFSELGDEAVAPLIAALNDEQRDTLADHPLVDVPRTLEMAAPYYLHMRELMTAPVFDRRRDLDAELDEQKAALQQRKEQATGLIEQIARQNDAPPTEQQQRRLAEAMANIAGEQLMHMLIANLSRTSESERNLRAQRHAVALTAACLLHQRRAGELPETLDALVAADMIAAVPADPFDGEPMRYDPARRLIWSVGADGSDDNGVSETVPGVRFAGPDVVWKIP